MLQSFVYSVLLGSRVLFSLTSLRSFCLRLPRAALPKTVNGLWSRNATRFLLAAYHSPQAVSGCAGSVGCEQREPDNRRSSRVPSNSFEWPRRKEEGEAKLFEIVSPEFGRCPFLQDFRSERQPVVLRFAEPPALSPWRSAPRGRATGRTSACIGRNGVPERRAWLLESLFGSFFEKKERLPQISTY